jgi:hypothetical protein
MVKRRRRRKYKPAQIFLALLALLGWFVPAIAFILYAVFVRGFLPTDRFFQLSIVLSSAVAAALTIALLPQLWSDAKSKYAQRDMMGLVKASFLAAFMPFFVFFPFHVFVSHIVPYALHLGANGRPTIVVESVTAAWYGGKTCRRPAILEGDRFLMHRRVCGLTPEDNRSLEHGGIIELQGTMSPYGFQIERYRVISVHG